MSSQLEDFYDFYTESSEKEVYEDLLRFHDVHEKNNNHRNQMLHVLLMILIVIVTLLVIECLKRFIKSRRQKCEQKVLNSIVHQI